MRGTTTQRRFIVIAVLIPLLLASLGRSSAVESQSVQSSPLASECLGNLSLRAIPTNGTVPLTVYFVATEPAESNGTRFDWDFGDASTLSGDGAAFSDPVHVYLSVGDVVVRVTTTDPWGQQSCLAAVQVDAQALSVDISEGLTQGPAPLRVTLSAFIVGGTGVYTAVVWGLSDGSSFDGRAINFTLTQPGIYQIRVNVTDSAGSQATNAANIDVLAPPGGAAPLPYLLWIGVIVISVVGGVAAGTLLGRGRSERPEWRGTRAPSVGANAPSIDARVTQGDPPGSSVPGPTVSPPTPAGVRQPSTVALTGASGGANGSVPRGRSPVPISPEAVQVSRRIIQHLRSVQYLDQPGHAAPGLTQGGILKALNLRQGAVASALARHVAAKVVEVRLDHVGGRPRRLKIYRLTPLGERVRAGLGTEVGASPRSNPPDDRSKPG